MTCTIQRHQTVMYYKSVGKATVLDHLKQMFHVLSDAYTMLHDAAKVTTRKTVSVHRHNIYPLSGQHVAKFAKIRTERHQIFIMSYSTGIAYSEGVA